MVDKNQKTYWPHMILGFLAIGITLGYWTIKSAISLPVQESNNYMMKYQQADMHMNDILEKKIAFDKVYTIEILNVETMVMTDNVHSQRPQANPVKLRSGVNHFSYLVTQKDGTIVSDANVSFLLTQPHSRRNDFFVENVAFTEGKYRIKDIEINNPGRYTLKLRVVMPDGTGFSTIAAYLKP